MFKNLNIHEFNDMLEYSCNLYRHRNGYTTSNIAKDNNRYKLANSARTNNFAIET